MCKGRSVLILFGINGDFRGRWETSGYENQNWQLEQKKSIHVITFFALMLTFSDDLIFIIVLMYIFHFPFSTRTVTGVVISTSTTISVLRDSSKSGSQGKLWIEIASEFLDHCKSYTTVKRNAIYF